MPLSIDDPICQALLQKVDQLSPLELGVLQVLAVADEPLNAATALTLCTDSGLLAAAASQNSAPITSLTPQLRRLKKLDLIGEGNQVNECIIEVIVRRIFADTQTRLTPPPRQEATRKKITPNRSGTQTRTPKIQKLPLSVPLAHAIVEAVQTLLPVPNAIYYLRGTQLTTACRRKLRELRLTLVDPKKILLDDLVDELTQHCLPTSVSVAEAFVDPVVRIVNTPFDPAWIQSLPAERQAMILKRIFINSYYSQEDDQQALELALDPERLKQMSKGMRVELTFQLVVRLILGGRLDAAQELLRSMRQEVTGDYDFGLSAWITLLGGNVQEAISLFGSELKELRQRQGKRNLFLNNLTGPYFIFALLQQGDLASLKQAATLLKLLQHQQYEEPIAAYSALEAILGSLNGISPESARRALPPLSQNLQHTDGPSGPLFVAMAIFSISGRLSGKEISVLEQLFTRCQATGLDWAALEYAQLLCRANKETPARHRFIDAVTQATGITPLSLAIKIEDQWQKSLRALHLVVEDATNRQSQSSVAGQARVVYMLNFNGSGELTDIAPLEQKRNAKGIWSKGRPIALQRLMSGEKLDNLTQADQGLRAAIQRHESYYSGYSFDFNLQQALPALVGHPLLFLADSPTTAVEIIRGEPEFQVVAQKNTVVVHFTPQSLGEERYVLIRETPTRYRLVELNPTHHQMARILGSKGISLPASALSELNTVLSSVASLVPVHSTVPGTAFSVETVPADSQPKAHLLPHGDGLRLEIFVKPLGKGGPYLKPGIGAGTLMADVDGRRCQSERDLKEEQQRAAALVDNLPSLAGLAELEGQWFATDVAEALQLLLELQEAQTREEVQVEWPEGEKLKVGRTLSFADMHLRVKSSQSWFEVDGEIRVDNERVLDMRRLLDLLTTTPHRFLPLGDGEFVAISSELRKRLDELAAFSDRKGKKLQLHPLAALAMEDFTEQIGQLDAAPQWRQRLEAIREGMAQTPQPPSTLKARLRDYQLEGFQWLARLAHLEFGACLADDMGLGKTIQALTAILHCAGQGPTLVVAPTSVCGNWLVEARRFAPTLQLIVFGGSDRAGLLADLGPFDVVIASYGLLYQESDLLTAVDWQTVVLDEAQAIKNAATKRSQAAMHLKARFRLITTGTPIENHLSEFWTLFNFINPGLLGSKERFNTRFAHPIERMHDREAGRRLKKLVRPFILRRLKTQVLEELPPRTEVMLEVELSPEETALYEALRQQALERIEAEQGTKGGTPMRILAEITRLRQACCHPRLLAPESTLSGSKLNLFGEVVTELLENGHKALVFSQFVGHLALIREYLDAQKIDYRYLDGSTPAKERQREVDAFQSGQGDLFLISLRAGGLGLNLTAADYVLHMDPWWNPAVEDQASDRAHRMGQERPVTVYRLVAKNTIEEKIVRLHAEKRDLADSLLEETDTGATLSADELLRLIREA
ncbi:MAG: DEAD/DEAH box helicase [Desulfobulbus sp.]|nr:DEAD/DEAH box helicase [Desulfobulbus sp.]